jgi:hypothetical protein
MDENKYLQQVATLTGSQYHPQQGPWGRKSGSVVGTRDGYITVIGFSRNRSGSAVAILVRFKKQQQAYSIKAALKGASLPKRKGHLVEVGVDFLRWDWNYLAIKPKTEEVAKVADALRDAIRPLAPGFDGRCQECGSASMSSMTLVNGVPALICAGCQERMRQDVDKAGVDYEAIVPNYPNGLVLGIGAALAGGIAWGVIAYGINRIFLYGAIAIGYFVAWAVLKGTGRVTRLGQVVIPILTVASVLFGDAIFWTLRLMKYRGVPFSGELLNSVIVRLWALETHSSNFTTIIFALIGAGYAIYAARKPKFKVVFQPLGVPNA